MAFRSSPKSSQAKSGVVPRWCHDRFLPNPFHFIMHQSRYTVRDADSVVKSANNSIAIPYYRERHKHGKQHAWESEAGLVTEGTITMQSFGAMICTTIIMSVYLLHVAVLPEDWIRNHILARITIYRWTRASAQGSSHTKAITLFVIHFRETQARGKPFGDLHCPRFLLRGLICVIKWRTLPHRLQHVTSHGKVVKVKLALRARFTHGSDHAAQSTPNHGTVWRWHPCVVLLFMHRTEGRVGLGDGLDVSEKKTITAPAGNLTTTPRLFSL